MNKTSLSSSWPHMFLFSPASWIFLQRVRHLIFSSKSIFFNKSCQVNSRTPDMSIETLRLTASVAGWEQHQSALNSTTLFFIFIQFFSAVPCDVAKGADTFWTSKQQNPRPLCSNTEPVSQFGVCMLGSTLTPQFKVAGINTLRNVLSQFTRRLSIFKMWA